MTLLISFLLLLLLLNLCVIFINQMKIKPRLSRQQALGICEAGAETVRKVGFGDGAAPHLRGYGEL